MRAKPLVGFQRIAAGRDKIDHVVEIAPGQAGIGRGGQHFAIEITCEKRLAAGAAEHMLRQNVERAGGLAAGAAEHVLRQHIERAGPQRRGVLRILRDGIDRHPALQHLEAIGRHQHGARGFVDAVVGAADPLHQPRGALRRADIDDEIDVAPVDAEIKRGRADHAAQPSRRHRILDLAALRDIERAVMQRDGEAVVVHAPQILKQHLGLAAGVDEHQRGVVAPDQMVDFAERMARGVPGPGQPLARVEHLDNRRRGAAGDDDIGGFGFGRRLAAPETAPAIPARRRWRTARSRAVRARAATAAPARATAGHPASRSPAHATRRARCA